MAGWKTLEVTLQDKDPKQGAVKPGNAAFVAPVRDVFAADGEVGGERQEFRSWSQHAPEQELLHAALDETVANARFNVGLGDYLQSRQRMVEAWKSTAQIQQKKVAQDEMLSEGHSPYEGQRAPQSTRPSHLVRVTEKVHNASCGRRRRPLQAEDPRPVCGPFHNHEGEQARGARLEELLL